MRLHLLSDLHHDRFPPTAPPRPKIDLPDVAADVVILAGDIDSGADGVHWAVTQAERLGKPLLYIPGNHEYYGQEYHTTLAAMRAAADGSKVTVLDENRWLHQGVRFLGCTLWTDYATTPAGHDAIDIASKLMPDHHIIRFGERLFTPQDALALHQRARDWLAAELAVPHDGPTVVITHHGPTPDCSHPRFSPGPLDGAFFSDLSALLSGCDLWLFGHTHVSLDLPVNGARLVSNQRGYPGEPSGFDAEKVILLPRRSC